MPGLPLLLVGTIRPVLDVVGNHLHEVRSRFLYGASSFWISLWYLGARGISGRHVAPGPVSGQGMVAEKLWGEFFSDPSQWWDNRSEKVNPRYPDFKHKKTQEALWLDNSLTPSWVKAELARVAPGTLQSDIFSWNVRLRRYVKAGDHGKTIVLFHQMQQEGMIPDKFTFVPVLKACCGLQSLEEGRRVHEKIIQTGCESDVYVANCLVYMYAKFASIGDAWSVFNKMRTHSLFSWNALIGVYVKSEQGLKAMELFRKMQQEAVEPDVVTFIAVLNACASVRALEEGRHVHRHIIERGCESNVYVGNCLVDMYAKCGSIEEAWSMFNKMRERNVVSWSVMIGAYGKSGQGLKAMDLFRKMQQGEVEPDGVTFIGVLNACAGAAALEEGRRVHEIIIQRGFDCDAYVATCLVDMYAKCGSIEDAWNVFDKIPEQDVVSWNVMIGGYVKSGQGLKAIELFIRMQQEAVQPDAVTFVGVLNACASVAALDEGRRVHQQILERGYQFNVYLANCLVDMYAKCGSIKDAWFVFAQMRERNVVSWNAMIGGYVMIEQGMKAMELFQKMQQEKVEPNAITFVRLLNACVILESIEEGRLVHKKIIERGCESDVYVANCLVDMYAKCGSVEDAWSMFNKMQERNAVSWNAIIGGCVKSGQGLKAIELFREMHQEGVELDTVTFVVVLNACASVVALKDGRQVHEVICQRGCESDVYVATGLVDMYIKCGSIQDAWSVFNKMQEPDVVSWNIMIGGYVKSEEGLKVLELFQRMQQKGVEPNSTTFVRVLSACANVVAIEEGRRVHGQIIERACEADVYVANCLIDMYAKCGSIEDAWTVFIKMQERDVVSWSAMIGGYAMHGHCKKAIGLFKWMGKEGVDVNKITFTCLLSACTHGGLVKEGLRYFRSMTSCYDILPTTEHYACIVDLLGRAGQLQEVEEMAKRMPMERNDSLWMSLLGACRIHGNMEIAEWAAKRFSELNPEDASGHVLLSNIYAAAGTLDRSADIAKERLGLERARLQLDQGECGPSI